MSQILGTTEELPYDTPGELPVTLKADRDGQYIQVRLKEVDTRRVVYEEVA